MHSSCPELFLSQSMDAVTFPFMTLALLHIIAEICTPPTLSVSRNQHFLLHYTHADANHSRLPSVPFCIRTTLLLVRSNITTEFTPAHFILPLANVATCKKIQVLSRSSFCNTLYCKDNACPMRTSTPRYLSDSVTPVPPPAYASPLLHRARRWDQTRYCRNVSTCFLCRTRVQQCYVHRHLNFLSLKRWSTN